MKNIKIGISIGIFLLALFGTVGVVFGGISSNGEEDITGDSPELVVEEGEEWDGSLPKVGETSEQIAEFTEIPGYGKITLTEEFPELELINPEGYTVYFVYTSTENAKIVDETGAIEPNKFVTVNLYELLSKGNHILEFSIGCFDLTTQAVCNGAIQEVEVVIR